MLRDIRLGCQVLLDAMLDSIKIATHNHTHTISTSVLASVVLP